MFHPANLRGASPSKGSSTTDSDENSSRSSRTSASKPPPSEESVKKEKTTSGEGKPPQSLASKLAAAEAQIDKLTDEKKAGLKAIQDLQAKLKKMEDEYKTATLPSEERFPVLMKENKMLNDKLAEADARYQTLETRLASMTFLKDQLQQARAQSELLEKETKALQDKLKTNVEGNAVILEQKKKIQSLEQSLAGSKTRIELAEKQNKTLQEKAAEVENLKIALDKARAQYASGEGIILVQEQRKKIAGLETELFEAKSRMDIFEKQNKALQDKVAAMDAIKADLDKARGQLLTGEGVAVVQEQKRRIALLETGVAEAKARGDALEKQGKVLEKKVQDGDLVKTELAKVKVQLDTAHASNTAAAADLAAQKKASDALQASLNEAKARLVIFEQQGKTLQEKTAAVETLKADLVKARAQLVSGEGVALVAELRQKIAGLEKDATAAKASLDAAEKQKTAAVDVLKADLAKARAQLVSGEGVTLVAEQKQKIAALEKEVADAKVKLDAAEKQKTAAVDALKADLVKARAQLLSGEGVAAVAEQKQKVSALEKELASAKSRLNYVDDQTALLKQKSAEVDALKAELAKSEAQLVAASAVTADLSEQKKKAATLQASLDEAKAQMATLELQNKALQEKTAAVDLVKADLEKARTQLASGDGISTQQKQKISGLENDLLDARARLDAFEKQNKALQEKIIEIDSLKTSLANTKTQISSGESASTAQKQKIAALEKELADAKILLENSGKQGALLQQKSNEIDVLKADLAKSEARLTASSATGLELAEQKRRGDDLQKKAADLQASLDEARTRLNDFELQGKALQQKAGEVDLLKAELEKAKMQLMSGESATTDQKQRISQMETDFLAAKARLEDFEKQGILLQEKSKEIDVLKADLEAAKSQLETGEGIPLVQEQRQKMHTLERALVEARAQMDLYRKQIAGLQEKTGEIDTLKADLAKARTQPATSPEASVEAKAQAAKVASLEVSLANAKARLVELEKQNGEIDVLKADLAKARVQLAAPPAGATEAQAQAAKVPALEASLADAKVRLDDLEKQNKDLLKKSDELDSLKITMAVAEGNAEIQKAQAKKVEELESSLAKASVQVGELEKQNKLLQEKITALPPVAETKPVDAEPSATDLAETKPQFALADGKIEVQERKKKVESLESDLAEARARQTAFEKLNGVLTEKNAELEALKAELARVKESPDSDAEAQKKKVESLEARLIEVNARQDALDKLSKALQVKPDEVETLKAELGNARSELESIIATKPHEDSYVTKPVASLEKDGGVKWTHPSDDDRVEVLLRENKALADKIDGFENEREKQTGEADIYKKELVKTQAILSTLEKGGTNNQEVKSRLERAESALEEVLAGNRVLEEKLAALQNLPQTKSLEAAVVRGQQQIQSLLDENKLLIEKTNLFENEKKRFSVQNDELDSYKKELIKSQAFLKTMEKEVSSKKDLQARLEKAEAELMQNRNMEEEKRNSLSRENQLLKDRLGQIENRLSELAKAERLPERSAPVEIKAPANIKFSGTVQHLDPSNNFVIFHFPRGSIPAASSKVDVYRGGIVVGRVQISEPIIPPYASANVIEGSLKEGDGIR